MTNRTSQQLCVAKTKPKEALLGNKPAFRIDYTRIDGETPKDKFITYFQGQFAKDQDSQKVLMSIVPGVEFVLIKEEKPNPNNPAISFWNVKEFRNASTWEAKPVSTFKKFGGGSNGAKQSADNTGAQIGNALKLSVETLGAGKTITDYKTRAWEIILLGDELRTELEAHRAGGDPTHTAHQRDEEPVALQQLNATGGDDLVPF